MNVSLLYCAQMPFKCVSLTGSFETRRLFCFLKWLMIYSLNSINWSLENAVQSILLHHVRLVNNAQWMEQCCTSICMSECL